jgi:outer membrane cobalamin receptor
MNLERIFFLLLCFISNQVYSQIDKDSIIIRERIIPFLKLDTNQFVKNDISTLNSFSLRDVREIPGNIEVITHEEIQAMGAKDLIDVLSAVSGISLGRDVEDGVGIGIRGLWAQEGKVLVMVNGIPVNDLDFGTYNLGGRLPVIFINRIEITLGPGSLKYGGTAALGVINVILKNREDFAGTWVNADYSYSNGFTSRKSFSFDGNYLLENDFQLAVHLNSTSSLRSTRYQPYGRDKVLSWGDSSQVDCNNILVSLKRNRFSSTVFFSDYQYNISDQSNSVLMTQFGGDIKWEKKLFRKSVLTLHTIYIDQLPWLDVNTADTAYFNTNTHCNKTLQNVFITTKFNPKLSVDYGVQGYHQNSEIIMRNLTFAYNNKNEITVNDIAAFAEGVLKGKLGVLTIGGRLEHNSFTHLLFAPRVSYTKIIQDFYLKGMYVESFKTPTVQNMNLALNKSNLTHETVKSIDFAIGGNWGVKHNWEISLYRNEVINPIVYLYDATLGIDNYLNQNRSGTYGWGFRYYFKEKNTFLKFSGSRYHIISTSDLPQIETNADEDSYLGMPNYRYSVQWIQSFEFGISSNLSCTYQSNIYQKNNNLVSRIQDGPLINVGFQKSFLKRDNLKFNVGIFNVLNSEFNIGVPTDTDIAPMPLFHQQLNISLQYKLL